MALSVIFDYFQVFKWTKYFVSVKYFSSDDDLMCYAYLCLIYCSESYGRANYIQSLFDTADLYFANGRSICGNSPIDPNQRQNRVAACQLMFSYSPPFLTLNHFLLKGIKVL